MTCKMHMMMDAQSQAHHDLIAASAGASRSWFFQIGAQQL
jgi:hypothetical protein